MVPVDVNKSVCLDAMFRSMATAVLDIVVAKVDNVVFSASVHVPTDASATLVSLVAVPLRRGDLNISVVASPMSVLNAAQVMLALFLDVAVAVELIFAVALVAAALFFSPCLMSAVALALVLAGEQALSAVETSSSSFLHLPKALVQAFFAAVIFLLSLLMSHFFTGQLTVNSKVLLVQQVQASDDFFSRHSLVRAEKANIAVLQRPIDVVLITGRLALQEVLMLSSHWINRLVKFFNWVAPLLDLSPLHLRLEDLPPPASRILFRIGPKRPFLLLYYRKFHCI